MSNSSLVGRLLIRFDSKPAPGEVVFKTTWVLTHVKVVDRKVGDCIRTLAERGAFGLVQPSRLYVVVEDDHRKDYVLANQAFVKLNFTEGGYGWFPQPVAYGVKGALENWGTVGSTLVERDSLLLTK